MRSPKLRRIMTVDEVLVSHSHRMSIYMCELTGLLRCRLQRINKELYLGKWPNFSVSEIKHVPHRLLRSSVRCCRSPVTPAPAIRWLFHVSARSAASPSVVAPSLLLVLQSGIHCLTICAIQLLGQTNFDGLWKPTCLPVVSVSLTVR